MSGMDAGTVIEIDALLAMDDEAMLREAYAAAHGVPLPPEMAQRYKAALEAGEAERVSLVLDIVQDARQAGRDVTVRFGSPVHRYLAGAVARPGQPEQPGERLADISGFCRAEAEEFVRQCYLHLLGKKADPAGLKYHVHLLQSGTARAEIVARLLAAARKEGGAVALRLDGDALGHLVEDMQVRGQLRLRELLAGDDTAFISGLYQHILGKTVDADGLAAYLWLLKTEYSRLQVIARILDDARKSGRKVSIVFDLDLQGLADATAMKAPA